MDILKVHLVEITMVPLSFTPTHKRFLELNKFLPVTASSKVLESEIPTYSEIGVY
jgi:hypothetical protein